jgi:uncharacterized membrane protein YcjF (UPF0283 family)
MKSKLLSLAIALVALFTAGSAEATPSKTPNQQANSAVTYSTTIENQLNPRSVSQDEIIEKDSPKPTKKKRHLAAKIITGIGVAFGLVVAIFVLSYTAAQH